MLRLTAVIVISAGSLVLFPPVARGQASEEQQAQSTDIVTGEVVPSTDTGVRAEPERPPIEPQIIGRRSGYLTPFATKLPLIEKELKRVSAFQFHGYLRAGAGENSNGGNQVCFQDPGAPVKYRLGNECEDYTELLFNYDAYRQAPDGPYFRVNARVAFDGGWLVRFQNIQVFAPEIYVEGAKLFTGALAHASFWAGKRFFRQDQVHINDFYFWDVSGPGGGVEQIDVGIGKLGVAYFRTANTRSEKFPIVLGDPTGEITVPGMTVVANNQVVSKAHVHWAEVPINRNGTLDLAVEGRQTHGDRTGAASTYGVAVYAMHTQKLLGGFNQAIFQFGQGLAADVGLASDYRAESSARTYRLIDWILVEPSPQYSAVFVAIYQRATGLQSQPKHWFSIGMRPIYNFNERLRIALEVGADFVDPREGSWRDLAKVTLAPEIAVGRKFLDRPVVRLFGTYAKWNSAAADNGVVLSDSHMSPFANQRYGLTFGVQAEAWW
jgi:maltoporin